MSMVSWLSMKIAIGRPGMPVASLSFMPFQQLDEHSWTPQLSDVVGALASIPALDMPVKPCDGDGG